jgi:hypothetical protein
MEIEGFITEECPVKSGTSERGPWKIAGYVLETMESFPKHIYFEVSDGMDNRIARLNIKKGKRMKIFFDINARKYEDRWFNSIRAFDAKETGYVGSNTTNNGIKA